MIVNLGKPVLFGLVLLHNSRTPQRLYLIIALIHTLLILSYGLINSEPQLAIESIVRLGRVKEQNRRTDFLQVSPLLLWSLRLLQCC